MENPFFSDLESANPDHLIPLDEVLAHLAFNPEGLIPVITQDANSKDILMMAWMNRQALDETLSSGFVTYWSRSRNQLWKKGATSGHLQKLIDLRIDCDGDSILCLAEQTGAACHTNRKHCFYLRVKDANTVIVENDTAS